jgi:hypothetical protein
MHGTQFDPWMRCCVCVVLLPCLRGVLHSVSRGGGCVDVEDPCKPRSGSRRARVCRSMEREGGGAGWDGKCLVLSSLRASDLHVHISAVSLAGFPVLAG